MSKYSFEAVIFDLDGVITKTALVHGVAWKEMFDNFLKEREERHGEPFKEFTQTDDYLPYVDGKPRYEGVASFLESRGIEIPFGTPEDDVNAETVCGLGNKKNVVFNEILDRDGVEVYQSTIKLIEQLKKEGIKIGVASSSKNCKKVLEAANLIHYFETRVDGEVSAKRGLKGKPEPDIFTTAADNLSVTYDKSVVVEDAVSGVQAGANGNFGMVIGLAREENNQELKINGADVVFNDIEELGGIEGIEKWFKQGLQNDMWSIKYNDYDKSKERSREALLTIGNGYFGTRGVLDESVANKINYPGTYISGLFNKLTSKVAGKDIQNEDLVNCPNWIITSFKINDEEWINPVDCNIEDIKRNLNFRNGLLSREIIIKDKKGRLTKIESFRFASMENEHLAGLKYFITPLNYSGKISIKTGLKGNIINEGVERYKELNQKHLKPINQSAEDNVCSLNVKTTQSKIDIIQSVKIAALFNNKKYDANYENIINEGEVYIQIQNEVTENKAFGFEKIVGIYTSKLDDVKNPLLESQSILNNEFVFNELLQKSSDQWKEIWDKIDIEISGDRHAQKLIRLHLYHLMVTSSHHNAKIDFGIPARGLHGEAYRGHIFWDELYVLPLYYFHFPNTAKSILKYRYYRLDKARDYAKKHGYKGAMFPWQSGSEGVEETQIIHLNPVSGIWGDDYSSLQRHISIAVAYNVWTYYHYTNDIEFLKHYGAEIFFEICRFWVSKAQFDETLGKYCINEVMGPDEFHEKYPDAEKGGLKNNSYTNIMVSWLLCKAIEMAKLLNETNISLTENELSTWDKISKNLKLEINNEGIIAQFDGYFNLEELDWNYYKEKYENIHRLDRILKAEGKSPDDYKLAKQADTLMLFYLLPEDEVTKTISGLGYNVPKDYFEKNFNYYIKRTSHGSTLSRVVHAYLAKLLNKKDIWLEFYMDALESDYNDIQGGTTGEGIHAGVMGGTVLAIIKSFAGINLMGKYLRIKPKLPDHWKKLKFNLNFKENHYKFEIDNKKIYLFVESIKNNEIDIEVCEKKLKVKTNLNIEIEY